MPQISFSRRALWHLNRSPLGRAVKVLVTARHWQQKQCRQRLAESIGIGDALRRKALALRESGYVLVDDIVDRDLLVAMAANAGEKVKRAAELARTQSSTHKNFWVRLLDEDMRGGAFDVDNVYVRYAVQPAILGLLAAYYGEIPILDYVLLTLSRDSEEEFSYSQLWHRDHDDVRTVKLFAYLTDVKSRDDGPFTFLPGPVSDRFGFSLKSHIADERVFSRAPKSEVIEIVAPRLTTFLVETSRCLHMGSRMSKGHSRLLYTGTFLSAPRMYPSAGTKFCTSRALSEVERNLFEI